MPHITIYHNGECSKCRGALELMQEQGIPHTVRWYLAEPLSRTELTGLLGKLGMQPSQLVRRGEPVFKELFEGKELSEKAWLDALVQYPILIERPIVETDDRAIVARPPERFSELIS